MKNLEFGWRGAMQKYGCLPLNVNPGRLYAHPRFWDVWKDPVNGPLLSYTMLTTNKLLDFWTNGQYH